jgi:SAM-dependent methyltransferase
MIADTPSAPPEKGGEQRRNAVGSAWEKRLHGVGYGSAGDARFLARFRASPYVQTILRYAQLPPGSLILEPGCGSGKFSLALASLGNRVIVLDYVAEVLHGVRATEQLLAGQWPGQLRGYCQGSLEQLPFPDKYFDLVLNEGVVEHWLDDEERLAVLREMVRVTRPGGVVAVLVPNGVHPLIRTWDKKLRSFGSAPPMTYYSAKRLERELALAGLLKIFTDGIYPLRSWTRLPLWRWLYKASALLDHLAPLPKTVRQKWGTNLIGLGSKE